MRMIFEGTLKFGSIYHDTSDKRLSRDNRHLLLLLDVARAVSGRLAGELLRMRLYRVGVEDLHNLAEVYTLDQLVDLLIIVVVTEHQKNRVNVPCLRQAHDQVSQVDDARVHLSQQSTKMNKITF